MIVIQGTEKINKGIVNIDSVKLQIKKGEQYPVSEADFYNSDVQQALRLNLIKQIGETPNSANQPDNEIRKVICKSIHPRDFTLTDLDKVIKPNEEFTIEENKLKDRHFQKAINNGIIKVVKTIEPSGYTEAFLELSSAFKKAKKAQEEDKDEIEEAAAELETNEEISGPVKTIEYSNVIDDEKPAPVRKSDIPDARQTSVTWNPTSKKPYNKIKNAKSVSSRKNKKTQQENTDSQVTFVDASEDIDDILFADHQLEKERIQAHPKLKNKDIEQNSEIDFIDE